MSRSSRWSTPANAIATAELVVTEAVYADAVAGCLVRVVS
jgi:hypothetical protein